MLRQIEVIGSQQKTLEEMYHKKIHEINAKLKMFNAKYNNWEDVEDRVKQSYTREEYKRFFIDRALAERSVYIQKLKNVRKGFVLE